MSSQTIGAPLLSQDDVSSKRLSGSKAVLCFAVLLGFLGGACLMSIMSPTPQPNVTAPISLAASEEPHLYYFQIEGRAEVTRMVLRAGGVSFTETAIAGKDWPAIKTEGPPSRMFGSVPVITQGGYTVALSQITASYSADLGMNQQYAPNAEERAYDNMLLTMHEESFFANAISAHFSKDPNEIKALPDKLASGLEAVERFLSWKPGPYLYKPESMGPSAGDLAIYDLVTNGFADGRKTLAGVDFSKYPKIQQLVEAVNRQDAFPGLTAYLKERDQELSQEEQSGETVTTWREGLKPRA